MRRSVHVGVLLTAAACQAGMAAADAGAAYTGRSFVSHHSGVFNGVKVDYTASVADQVLRDDAGRPVASIFATAYVRDGVNAPAGRPVIFLWNGGPGGASETLHLAGFGPRRLVVPADPSSPVEPPFRTEPNPHTVLDVADLVFVDPVGTGYSRLLPAGERAWFYSVDGDAASMARFMIAWLEEHGRAASPRFVLGTSYGSNRAAVVAGEMARRGWPLTGALLFSQGVNLVETTQREGNLVGYAANLSQEAAIAWYHGRGDFLERPVTEVVDSANAFAMTDYLVALARGNRLPEDDRRALADRLAAFTGLPADYYLANGLRITKSTFRRELLKSQGLVLGMTDARYTALADGKHRPDAPTEGVGAVRREYMEDFLGVTLPADEYEGFAPDAFGEWDWGGTSTMDGSKAPPGARRTVFADFDYAGGLVPAFEADGRFRVMIATGIYDTQTTVGPARLLAGDVRFPPERIVMHHYPAGHTFYADAGVFEVLADDVRRFIAPRR